MAGDGAISIREATTADFGRVEHFYREQDFGPTSPGWTDWKYSTRADGKARVFLAETDGRLVGTLSYLPRRFSAPGGTIISVIEHDDVLVHPDYRKRGVFASISEFARARVEGPRIAYPNAQSIRLGLRSGWSILGPRKEWRFPVRIGELPSVRSGPTQRRLLNVLSRLYASALLPARPSGISLEEIQRFDHDYTIPDVLHGQRSATYLNWRFFEDRSRDYHVLGFRLGADNLGYCAYRGDTSARVYDFVASRHERACMRALVEHCRGRGCTQLIFSGVGLRLHRLGFFR